MQSLSHLSLWGCTLQDSNLVRLASQQARRDEEVNQARQRAGELEAEVADLSREVELRQEQELTLKEVRETQSLDFHQEQYPDPQSPAGEGELTLEEVRKARQC